MGRQGVDFGSRPWDYYEYTPTLTKKGAYQIVDRSDYSAFFTGIEDARGQQVVYAHIIMPPESGSKSVDRVIILTNAVTDNPGRLNKKLSLAEQAATFNSSGSKKTAIIDLGSIGVDWLPGMEKNAPRSRLTVPQRRGLAEGSFSEVAIAQVGAIERIFGKYDISKNTEVILYGGSLGASQAAALAPIMRGGGFNIGRVVLVEGINNVERNQIPTLRQFMRSGEYADLYLAQNPDFVEETNETSKGWLRRSVADGLANASYWRAVTGNGMHKDLKGTGKEPTLEEIPFFIGYADLSEFNTQGPANATAKFLKKELGAPAEVISLIGHHAITMTLVLPVLLIDRKQEWPNFAR